MSARNEHNKVPAERHRRAFLNAALPGIWLDARGRVVELNEAAEKLLDVKETYLVGRPAVSIIDPDDRHDLVNFFISANNAGEGSLLRDVRVLAGDGPRSVKIGLAFIDLGADAGFFMQLHDVTELKATAAALDKTESSYRTFFEDHTVAMYRTRPDGEIVEANHALAAMAGYPHPKYLLSLNASQLFVSPEQRAGQVSELERTGELSGRDFQLARQDGTTIWVRDFARAIEIPDGSVIYEGALFDVDQRYEAEAQLHTRALQQASVAALGQLALQSHDAHAVALSAVRMVQEVLSLESVALVRGDPGKIFVRWDDPTEGRSLLDHIEPGWIRTKLPDDQGAVAVAGPDGGFVIVLGVQDVNGETGLLVGVLAEDPSLTNDDVHFLQAVASVISATLERSESRSRLEALVHSKDEFIASISHEVRTPLTVVMGVAHELESRWREIDATERAELLGLIVGQTKEMSDLIEDLLVAARADIGKLPIHVEPLDAGAEIKAVLESIRTPEGTTIASSPHNPIVYADPVRFRQIMRNLLTNAFRYGGDQIKINISHDDDRVWIDVVDNGTGVPAESREAIFEAYERAHRTSGRPGSVGLGLTVSRRLARLMGGDLGYRFEDGSVFTLELAAAPALMFWNGTS